MDRLPAFPLEAWPRLRIRLQRVIHIHFIFARRLMVVDQSVHTGHGGLGCYKEVQAMAKAATA
jgi:hypothetical protein